MDRLFRFTVILAVSFLGEALAQFIPLPVPGSIYGMLIMLLALVLKIVPLEKVKGESEFLQEIMPVLFVPAAVGILDTWGVLRDLLLPCMLAVLPCTLIVMAVSGLTVQRLLKHPEVNTLERDD